MVPELKNTQLDQVVIVKVAELLFPSVGTEIILILGSTEAF